MNAGRELDALVAEKVMGWEPWDWTSGDLEAKPGVRYFAVDSGAAMYDHAALVVYDSTSEEPVLWFSPSRDIAAAWQVVEAMQRLGGTPIITAHRDGTGAVMVTRGAYAIAALQGDTVPHAICLAALRTVEAHP